MDYGLKYTWTTTTTMMMMMMMMMMNNPVWVFCEQPSWTNWFVTDFISASFKAFRKLRTWFRVDARRLPLEEKWRRIEQEALLLQRNRATRYVSWNYGRLLT